MFTISNRTDAPGCTTMVQPNFNNAQATNNIIFRQTTPTYGTGLIELIQESAILANMNSNQTLKQSLGISGHPNFSDDDGTIAAFRLEGAEQVARSISPVKPIRSKKA